MEKEKYLMQKVENYIKAYKNCDSIELRKAEVSIEFIIESMNGDIEFYNKLNDKR